MTVQELPNWINKRYISLLEKFKSESFRFKEAASHLSERYEDSEAQVKVILSELKKASYLKVSRDPKDAREKIYKLIELAEAAPTNGLSRSELNSILKKAADIIRTRVDYTFILLLLFYKRMSDKHKESYSVKYKELVQEGWNKEEAVREAQNTVYYDFDFPEEFLWENLRKDPLRLSENLSKALKALSDRNPDFSDIFSQFDFIDFTRSPENNEILRQLFELFSQHSFETVSPDTLGDAYEWVLKYFAPTKAKEGEVYTPREVIQLMVEILKPEPEDSAYDPAAGSSGMLIGAYEYVKRQLSKSKANKLFLYGQEQNFRTLALAKMNLLIHDIRNANLSQGDTLLFPKFKVGDDVKKFDHVIANPPWNQDGYAEDTLKRGELWRERFPFGFPTNQSADWAWVQHMLASGKSDGKVAVVLDTGAVSRGGREKAIREKMVESDLIETVILLPEKLFYNTSAPGLIIVFNKAKPKERQGKVLLINASKEYKEGKPQSILGEENIKKIVEVYDSFGKKDGLSTVITLEDIKSADFNLSPSRFVSVSDEKEPRSIKKIWKDLLRVDEVRQTTETGVKEIIERLLP